jgi:hypothetical protein
VRLSLTIVNHEEKIIMILEQNEMKVCNHHHTDIQQNEITNQRCDATFSKIQDVVNSFHQCLTILHEMIYDVLELMTDKVGL